MRKAVIVCFNYEKPLRQHFSRKDLTLFEVYELNGLCPVQRFYYREKANYYIKYWYALYSSVVKVCLILVFQQLSNHGYKH